LAMYSIIEGKGMAIGFGGTSTVVFN